MRIALRTCPAAGGDFHLPEEMPPKLAAYYYRTLERFSARPPCRGSKKHAVIPKLSTRVIVDGQEFASVAEMPSEYRRFYEEILARAVPLERAIYTVARAEYSNFVGRTISLLVIAAGVEIAIIYLWLHGYYG